MKRLALALSLSLLAGCASYTVPGGPARLDALGVNSDDRKAIAASGGVASPAIREALAKKPMLTFPANIAMVHVQAAGYSNHHYQQSPQPGEYSVVTVREVETDDDFAQIAKLPQIQGIVPLKRILLNDQPLNSDEELRLTAARLHANLLLYYTFDTQFTTQTHGRELGVITLGLFPDKTAKAVCTASAVLMDVNNGYIYAVIEVTSKDQQLANAWSSEDAMDDVRQRVERDAFGKLVAEFKSEWVNVVDEYGVKR